MAVLVLEEVVDRVSSPEGIVLAPSVVERHASDYVTLLRPDGSALRAAVRYVETNGHFRLVLSNVVADDVPVGTRVFTA